MKKIVKTLGGIVFYLLFFISCIIVYPFLRWIQYNSKTEVEKTQRIQKLYRVWMRIFWYVIRIKVRHIDWYKIPLEGGIAIMNHSSFLDIMSLTPFFLLPNKTIAKNGPTKIPIFGTIWTSLSVIIDRNNQASKARGMKTMITNLALGIYPIIYPEGHRNKTLEKLDAFVEDGAFALSIKKKLPLIPIINQGAQKVLPPGLSFTPGTVTLTVLDPIYPLPNETTEELKNRAREIMLAHL